MTTRASLVMAIRRDEPQSHTPLAYKFQRT
jgi:hypothetical protein